MFHTIFYTPREELGYLLVHLGARRYERPGQGRVMHASESEDCIFADALGGRSGLIGDDSSATVWPQKFERNCLSIPSCSLKFFSDIRYLLMEKIVHMLNESF
jgi:hypothetical protein